MGLSFPRSLAVAAALGVLLTMLSAVTLLPAILGFVGTNIDRLGLPHRTRAHGGRGGVWHRWSRLVQRRPLTALVVGLAVLVVLAAPLFAIRLEIGSASCRARVCQSVLVPVVAGTLKKKCG